MGESAVILEGVLSDKSASALYSTVHGAGRVLSRTKAAGKRNRKTGEIKVPGIVDYAAWQTKLASMGIEIRGGGADEAPECYKRLTEVLAYHDGTVNVLHVLNPIGVAMAGRDVFDPFKD